MSYSLVLNGFETEEQVRAFISWYEGQGEQDAGTWFEIRTDINPDETSNTISMPMDMKSGVGYDGKQLHITLRMRKANE